MNENQDTKQAIHIFYQDLMDRLARQHEADYDELVSHWLDLHRFYIDYTNSRLEKWAQDSAAVAREGGLNSITAQQVIIEVTDQETGRTFRRTLPLEYLETDNGIKLSGDTLAGTPTHLAFLSETAIARMKDILGQGPDTHRCHD